MSPTKFPWPSADLNSGLITLFSISQWTSRTDLDIDTDRDTHSDTGSNCCFLIAIAESYVDGCRKEKRYPSLNVLLIKLQFHLSFLNEYEASNQAEDEMIWKESPRSIKATEVRLLRRSGGLSSRQLIGARRGVGMNKQPARNKKNGANKAVC